MCTNLLTDDGWLMCFFHRFDCSRDQFEQQVLENSGRDLEVFHRMTSGVDFPEENEEHKLRVSIFKPKL